MISFAAWTKAEVIAALALLVSSLAFIASAVSSLVSYRSYVASIASRTPKLRVYLEPFEATEHWWIAHFTIRNRSDNPLLDSGPAPAFRRRGRGHKSAPANGSFRHSVRERGDRGRGLIRERIQAAQARSLQVLRVEGRRCKFRIDLANS